MATWTADELERIGTSDELHIAPRREDGSLRRPTIIWVVRDGGDLYVRSGRGVEGVWFRAVRATHAGRVSAGGVTKDVTFVEETDPAVQDRVDAAYRAKYARYPQFVGPMVADGARAATLRLQPC